MSNRTAPAIPDTFTLERSYPRPAERVFALLATADSKRQWLLGDDGTIVDSFHMDFRVGGTERAAYSIKKGSPVDGLPFVNEGMYLDIVPNQRVVLAYYMSIGGRRISASQVTFEISAEKSGSKLTLIHQAVFFEGADGPEMRKGGWNALLDRLGAVVAKATS
jgi:uncharacterized protein YndB with AHSA1/START domain